MRRLALSVFTACGLAVLAGCSGGTGLQTGSTAVPTSITFNNGSGQVNDFIVSPNNTAPVTTSQALSVTATAIKGNGINSVVVPNATFTWAARFVTAADPPSVQEYLVGPSPSGYKQCGFLTATSPTPAVPIYTVASGSVLLSPLGSNTSDQVFIAPVAGVVPASTASGYCMVLQATASPGNVIGAITVAVTN